MSTGRTQLLPPERRPTYYFLQYAKQFSPVYLSTEVDMTAVRAHRQDTLQQTGRKLSYVSYLIRSASLAIRQFPEANVSVRHGLFPRLMRHRQIHAKFTLDKIHDGARFVVPGMVADSDEASLERIQERVNYFRDGSFESLDEFKNARLLRKLPLGIGQWIYQLALSHLERRARLQGTFTVTSLGHRPITAFYPVISATLCFGMGTIEPRPVVREGVIVVRDMLSLSFAFDHAALDGALAADLLAAVKTNLEDRAWEQARVRQLPLMLREHPPAAERTAVRIEGL